MNTKTKGEITEIAVASAIMKLGHPVLMPIGDNQRYDLAFELEDGTIRKVQCKTGKMSDDESVITFKTCSTYAHRGRKPTDYKGQVDFFGVYCFENDCVYLISVDEVGKTEATLRLTRPKNNQEDYTRYAESFQIWPVVNNPL